MAAGNGTFDPSDAVLDAIGTADGPFDVITPGLFVRAIVRTTVAAASQPASLAAPVARFLTDAARSVAACAARGGGLEAAPTIEPASNDRRFDDPAWRDNAAYLLMQQLYLLTCRLADEVVDAGSMNEQERAKARFAVRFLADALAPTNQLLGNPAAVRRAFDTGGRSLVRGARNFVRDLRHNGGWPSQVDASAFAVGENMATSAGSVVFRNELIELIEYAPLTERVHSVPLLMCPPWINKFYIMDLAPGRSLVEWALTQGHRCFMISYRNPSGEDLGFEDYLHNGPLAALEVVKSVARSSTVNTLSVCLGGTLSAIAMAYQAAAGDQSVNTATFINSHTDFTEPGLLGAFTDEATVRNLELRMRKHGFLEARQMALTFDALRANDLIFQYVGKNWLQGQTPPAFDLLAWNNDSTNMPARMHSEYLRSCFLRNEFALGEMMMNGFKLDPGAVRQDTYIVSAVDDHIVPWTSAFRTAHLLGGRNRFVLAGSGHIAGIVTPPGPKAKHWVNDELPVDPVEWRDGATLVADTWWRDWADWIAPRSGALVAAPKRQGSRSFPVLGSAPGEYVRERAA